MTRPIGTPMSIKQRLGQLQARFDGFRHRVGDVEAVELGGMGGIAGACDDGQIRPLGARRRDHRFDGGRAVHGHDEGAGTWRCRTDRSSSMRVASP